MTSQHDKAKRWRPWQFSLSTLLLLTTVVAVAVGWWIDRRHLVVGTENLRHNVKVLKAVVEGEKRALEVERSKLNVSRKMQMLHAESIQSYIRNIQILQAEVEDLRRMQLTEPRIDNCRQVEEGMKADALERLENLDFGTPAP